MRNIKSEVKELHNELESMLKKDGRDTINVQPHVYVIELESLKRMYGLTTTQAKRVANNVILFGKDWEAQGIGGYDIFGTTYIAFMYKRPGVTKSSTNIFNSSQFNELHKNVRESLTKLSKEASSIGVDKGHFMSSAAIESRMLAIDKLASKGTYSEQAIGYVRGQASTAASTIYNRIRIAIQKNIKARRLNIGMDLVQNYKGPNQEMEGQFVVFITPQPEDLNRNILGPLEKEYPKLLERLVNNRIHTLLDVRGSPSFLEIIGMIFDAFFVGISGFIKERGLFKVPNSFKHKASAKSNLTTKPKVNIVKGGAMDGPSAPSISKSTKEIPGNLQALLNAQLTSQIRKNMGDGTAIDVLNWRTGRFGHSAAVTAVVRTRKDHIMIFYNYMKYPYATFDPGGAQYKSTRRGPRQIIDQSIRELATQLVYDRFAISTKVN